MIRSALICCVFASVWFAEMRLACADWQYTKWGMKEAEVIAASGGKAVPPTAEEVKNWKTDDGSPRLKAPYSTGPYRFIAVFYFDKNDALTMVILQLNNTSLAHDLVGDLRAKYGNETDGNKTSVMEYYVWRLDSDQVGILLIGCCGKISSAALHYRSRITESNEGL